jgi:hypothetical protein
VSRHRGVRRLAIALMIAGPLAAGVMATSGAPPAATAATTATAGAAPPALSAPLAAALTTPSGSWAVVAMGQRGVALNTFWEIFFRANGATTWTLVTPTGVADNGGLTLAAAPDGSVTVGFEPSQLLHFSPLARSSDGGATWNPGLLSTALLAVPDAMAVSGRNGAALALVRRGSGEVLASRGGSLLGWRPLPGDASLMTGAGASRCDVTGLRAVAYGPSATPMVGTGCGRAGQVGVFARIGAGWALVGPTLTGAARGRASVLRLTASGDDVSALVSTAGARRTGLLGLWRAAGAWSLSAPVPLSATQRVLASAVGADGQQLVLLSRGTAARLELAAGPGRGWTALAAPPAGTATVALLGDGSVDAFSVQGSRLRIFTAAPGHGWVLTQTTRVPLAYGSS